MTPASGRGSARLGALRATLRGQEFRRVRLLWSAELGSVAAQVVSGLVVARVLGPSAYGAFALLLAYGGLIYAFVEPRAGELVIKYFGTATERERSADAWAVLRFAFRLDAAAVMLAIAVTLAAFPLARGIAPGTLLDVALAAGSVALLGPVVTGRSVLSVLDRYGDLSRLQTAASVVRATATAVAALATRDVTAVLAALAVTTGAEVLATTLLARQASVARHGRRSRGTSWSPLAVAAPGAGRFLALSEANTMLASLTKYADTLLIGAYAGAEQAGLYRLARSLTQPVANLITPLQTVAYNRLVRDHVQDDGDQLVRTTRRATVLALPLALALALGTVLVPWVVRLLAGDDFSAAGPIAVVLMLGVAAGLPWYWLRGAYVVLDRLRTWVAVGAVTTVVSVVGFRYAAQISGALGVAVVRVVVLALITNLVLALLLRTVSRRAATAPEADPPDAPDAP